MIRRIIAGVAIAGFASLASPALASPAVASAAQPCANGECYAGTISKCNSSDAATGGLLGLVLNLTCSPVNVLGVQHISG